LGTLNANVPGSFASGRRETNWDGVPDNFAAPTNPFVDPALRRMVADAVAATGSGVSTTIQAKVEEKNGQEKEDATLQVSIKAFPNPLTRHFTISFESTINGPPWVISTSPVLIWSKFNGDLPASS
jgi:hypothetical protein